MKRLFLVYDEKDFAEWIEEELAEYGRFIRKVETLDFFIPQWNAVRSADVIILPETVVKSDDSFLGLYQLVKRESPETLFLFIYFREKDQFIKTLGSEGNLCISYDELDTGLLIERLRETHFQPSNPTHPTSTLLQPSQDISPMGEKMTAGLPGEGNKDNSFEDDPTKEYPLSERLKESQGEEGQEQPLGLQARDDSRQEAAYTQKRRPTEEQKAKLQKIKERIVIEEKIVTVHVPIHFTSLLVSIISLYPRAGATFVAANFAMMLGENKVPVAVIEPVSQTAGSTYYELMYGEKNAPKGWQSWAAQLHSNGFISNPNNWQTGGVTWVPSNVEPTPYWNEELTMQLLLAAKRFPVTMCDLSSSYNEGFNKKILHMSDEVWIVTDGDPIQLGRHYKVIDNLRNEYPGKKMKVIGNKWNRYIKQSEWKEAVLLPVLTQIPDLGSIVVKHLWDGKMVWEDTKLKNILSSPFKPMARAVVAKEMFSLIKKQYGLRAKLSGLLKQLQSLEDESTARRF